MPEPKPECCLSRERLSQLPLSHPPASVATGWPVVEGTPPYGLYVY
jgi:hypothetical protein